MCSYVASPPHFPKKDQKYRHSACHNHPHPSRELLFVRNCYSDPWCTWYCHRNATELQETVQVCRVVHYGLLSRKLVPVAINCIYRTSDQLEMFINGACLRRMIVYRVSLPLWPQCWRGMTFPSLHRVDCCTVLRSIVMPVPSCVLVSLREALHGCMGGNDPGPQCRQISWASRDIHILSLLANLGS